jgi:excisionase family DNA binding protein
MSNTQTPAPPPLLTVNEAAAQLKVSREQIYKLIKRGELVSIVMRGEGGETGSRRIEQSELDAYIARNRDHAASG